MVDRNPIPPGVAPDEISSAYYDPNTNTVHTPPGVDRYGRAHEVGHALDHENLSDGDRAFFQRLMHAPQGQWQTGTGSKGLYSPNEMFADYYAAVATGYDPKPKKLKGGGTRYSSAPSSYATNIGPKRLKRFAKALERLQARQGLSDYEGA